MKNVCYKLCAFLLVSLIAALAFGKEGGNSGGGGNVGGSTKSDVRNALEQIDNGGIYNFLPTNPMTWFSILKQSRSTAPSGNADIEALLDKMFTSTDGDFHSSAIYKDWLNTPRKVNDDTPCLGDGKPSDASVAERKLGSPVCVSISRLQRIPKSTLVKELDALMAHEFAHHFGADETLAKNFQRYFLDKVERLVRYVYASDRLTNDIFGVYGVMDKSIRDTLAAKTFGAACASLGNLSGLFLDAMRSSDVIEYSDMNDIAKIGANYTKALFGARDFYAGSLIGYCDKDSWSDADRKAVTALVYRLAAKIKATRDFLPFVALAAGSYAGQGSGGHSH